MANVPELAEQTSPLPPAVELTEAELFANDPLLSAIGTAKGLWKIEADGSIPELHEGWD